MKVRIDSTCSIDYEVRGSGPPVLFIQGVGVQGDGWLPQVEALSSRFTCITFDNRGLGKSTWSEQQELNIELMAKDAHEVLMHSGFPSASIVGHSLGGTIALALALLEPQAVRCLALLCTFPAGKFVAPLTLRMIWLGMRASVGTKKMRRRGFLDIVSSPGTSGDKDQLATRLSELFGHDIADQPPIAKKQLKALRKACFTERLGQLAGIRTLVVSAQHDPIAPPNSGLAIAERIKGAEYIEVQGASHGLPITHADKTNAILSEFFDHPTSLGQ